MFTGDTDACLKKNHHEETDKPRRQGILQGGFKSSELTFERRGWEDYSRLKSPGDTRLYCYIYI